MGAYMPALDEIPAVRLTYCIHEAFPGTYHPAHTSHTERLWNSIFIAKVTSLL